MAAYYIVSEALTNAVKYARAPSCTSPSRHETRCFASRSATTALAALTPPRGPDSWSLRDRAEAMGGTMLLESWPGAGHRCASSSHSTKPPLRLERSRAVTSAVGFGSWLASRWTSLGSVLGRRLEDVEVRLVIGEQGGAHNGRRAFAYELLGSGASVPPCCPSRPRRGSGDMRLDEVPRHRGSILQASRAGLAGAAPNPLGDPDGAQRACSSGRHRGYHACTCPRDPCAHAGSTGARRIQRQDRSVPAWSCPSRPGETLRAASIRSAGLRRS